MESASLPFPWVLGYINLYSIVINVCILCSKGSSSLFSSSHSVINIRMYTVCQFIFFFSFNSNYNTNLTIYTGGDREREKKERMEER